MRLAGLSIHGFRLLEHLAIDFHDRLTVIVARNGQGKSAVLDAASVALGTFVGAFDLGKAKHFDKKDARYRRLLDGIESEQQYPIVVKAFFQDPEMSAIRRLTGKKNRTTIKEAEELTRHGQNLMQRVRRLEDVSLPVIAYYGSGRLWNIHRNQEQKAVLSESRTQGYEDCLSSASSFKQVQHWMAKATMAVLQQSTMPDEYGHSRLPHQLWGVQQAVDRVLANEGWSHFHYSLSHEELAMFHQELGTLPVSLLSDGVRAMVSLTADLAWRCAKLNPHLAAEAPGLTEGIVFIDEVDLHLHPHWQQRVIHTLQTIFAKVQFIVTTHSPQVLTTVADDCIRILADGRVHSSPPGTEGAESARLLKRVLGVDVRPENNPVTRDLKRYLDLVHRDQWNSSEALALRSSLDGIYRGEEPALLEADLWIENRRWEMEE